MKNLVFYPVIVLSLSWAIHILLQLNNYVHVLRQEHPECTQSNPNFWTITIATTVMLSLTRRPIEKWGKRFFDSFINEKKFPLGSNLREGKVNMLGERTFRIGICFVYCAVLYKILLQEDCDFLDVRIGGRTAEPLFFNNYPC